MKRAKDYEKMYELIDTIVQEFQSFINSQGYVSVEQARKIIYTKLREEFGISKKEALERRVINAIWWIFSDSCAMYYSNGNGNNCSGIYKLDPAKIEANLQKYCKDIEKRINFHT